MFPFSWISSWWDYAPSEEQDRELTDIKNEIIVLDDEHEEPSPVRRTYAEILLSSVEESSCVGESCDQNNLVKCSGGKDAQVQTDPEENSEENSEENPYLDMARQLVEEAIQEAIASLSEEEFSARFPQYCHEEETRDPEPEIPAAPAGYVGEQDGTVPIACMTEFSTNYEWRLYEITVGEQREEQMRKWLNQERFYW